MSERVNTSESGPAGGVSGELASRAYASLLRHSPHLVGLLSAEGEIKYLSPAAVHLLCGQEAQDWDTARGLDAIHPDDIESVMHAFVAALEQPGVAVTFPHRTMHATGAVRHIVGTFHNLLDDADVGGIALYCADVTEHEQLAEELVAREADRERQLASEAAMSAIARAFVDRPTEEFGACVEDALAHLGTLLHVDRAWVLGIDSDGIDSEATWRWCAPGVGRANPEHASGRTIAAAVDESGALVIDDMHALGLPAHRIAVCDADGVAALMAVPIMHKDELIGYVGLHSSSPRAWESHVRVLLERYASLHAVAWTRRRAELQRVQTDATLYDARMRFDEVFEHAPIGMALADLDGRFFRVNPAFCSMLGRTDDEMLGRTFSEFTHPDDLAPNIALHEEVRGGQRTDYVIEKRYRRHDGSFIWCKVNVGVVRSTDGTPLYEIGQVTDVSEQKSNADALEREARYDTLTGLATRKLFLEALERELRASTRRPGTLAVLFIDLDHFKHVNDTLGHSAGDELLALAAKRLQSVLRGSDLACRFGGDEFVVLCPDLQDPADVAVVAERVRAIIERPFRIRETDLFVGASIGIAIADDGADPSMLLSQADSAAYRAKARGRNRYEVFDEELRSTISNRLATEQALRRAIDRHELVLAYQPIVDTGTGEVRRFEALLRWDRPGRGLVLPGEFLEVAEDRDLIVPIGYQVLEIACAQLAEWRNAAPDGSTPHIAVNVSARQFAHPEFAERVEKIITGAGVDPTSISLELTETTLMDDMIATSSALQRLRSFGLTFAIDDFGTGFSSLSYLRRMPVSVVKIDRSFVLELGEAPAGTAIVASVIQLAHALGMQVVAEGVDSAERVASLITLGCDFIQGFHFAPALPAAEALAYMHDNPDALRRQSSQAGARSSR